MKYNILDETFCIYCQDEFETPRKLQRHILRTHKGSYAEQSVVEARIARSNIDELRDPE